MENPSTRVKMWYFIEFVLYVFIAVQFFKYAILHSQIAKYKNLFYDGTSENGMACMVEL